MKHTKTKDRILESATEADGDIVIKVTTFYTPFGYTNRRRTGDSVRVTRDELVKICQAHGIVVPAPPEPAGEV